MRLRFSLVVAAALAGTVIVGGTGATAELRELRAAQPNIVVVSTDDQALSSFNRKFMPRTFKRLVARGASFENAIVATPLCCPSRAAFLTGQYGHNNGVLVNNYGLLLDKEQILPAWLQEAGYTTAHVGKYMNKYARFQPAPEVAPAGWDWWRTNLGEPKYFNFRLAEDGAAVDYSGGDQYLTDVLASHAKQLVRSMPEPFYLQVDHYAPHESGSLRNGADASGCTGLAAQSRAADFTPFGSLKAPRPPSFDERNVSDKAPANNLPGRFGRAGRKALDLRYRCMAAAVYSFDRAMARLIDELTRRGLFDDTLFVFWSDNGFHYGEHRMAGKGTPFDESLRVPLVIKAPGSIAASASEAAVSNVDLAPTILDYAGAEPCVGDECRTLDGRSLRPLIEGETPSWSPGRALLFESDANFKARKISGAAVKGGSSFFCGYAGIWDAKHSYIYAVYQDKYARLCETEAERTLFDLENDPYQLRALGPNQAALKRSAWDALLRQHLDCAGHDGVSAPACP